MPGILYFASVFNISLIFFVILNVILFSVASPAPAPAPAASHFVASSKFAQNAEITDAFDCWASGIVLYCSSSFLLSSLQQPSCLSNETSFVIKV